MKYLFLLLLFSCVSHREPFQMKYVTANLIDEKVRARYGSDDEKEITYQSEEGIKYLFIVSREFQSPQRIFMTVKR